MAKKNSSDCLFPATSSSDTNYSHVDLQRFSQQCASSYSLDILKSVDKEIKKLFINCDSNSLLLSPDSLLSPMTSNTPSCPGDFGLPSPLSPFEFPFVLGKLLGPDPKYQDLQYDECINLNEILATEKKQRKLLNENHNPW